MRVGAGWGTVTVGFDKFGGGPEGAAKPDSDLVGGGPAGRPPAALMALSLSTPITLRAFKTAR